MKARWPHIKAFAHRHQDTLRAVGWSLFNISLILGGLACDGSEATTRVTYRSTRWDWPSEGTRRLAVSEPMGIIAGFDVALYSDAL